MSFGLWQLNFPVLGLLLLSLISCCAFKMGTTLDDTPDPAFGLRLRLRWLSHDDLVDLDANGKLLFTDGLCVLHRSPDALANIHFAC